MYCSTRTYPGSFRGNFWEIESNKISSNFSAYFRINKEKFNELFETNENSPFNYEKGEGFDEGSLDDRNDWIVSKYLQQYRPLFDQLKSANNKVTGKLARLNSILFLQMLILFP